MREEYEGASQRSSRCGTRSRYSYTRYTHGGNAGVNGTAVCCGTPSSSVFDDDDDSSRADGVPMIWS